MTGKKIFTVWFRLLLMIIILSSGITYAQDKDDPRIIRRQVREQLHRHQSLALERTRELEKRFLSQKATNWQEYDITYYDADWQFYYSGERVSGSVGIYGHPVVSLLDSVIVNMSDSLQIDSVYNSSGVLTHVHASDHLTIYLDRNYAQGEEFGFTVVYSGDNLDYWSGLQFDTYNGTPTIQSLSQMSWSRTWWPCNDILVDKADSIDIGITVDAGQSATSNGLLISDTDNGDGTHTMHWQSHYPISTYLICIAVGDYISWDDYYVYSPTDSMPIINYVYFDQYSASHEDFAITADAMQIYASFFGEYPFVEEKYGHTQTEGYLGMEHQTNTFIMPDVDPTTTEYVVIHELAHQWWGDMVTCGSWHDIWLNEGFATYSDALYYETLNGYIFYRDYMEYMDYFDDGSVYSYDTVNISPGIFNNRVYNKGAWVLHMLRGMLGDSIFFDILQTYAETFAYQTALTEDFQAVCETVSGQDLDYFFQQWIYGVGRPSYIHCYYTEEIPSGGWDTYVMIRQIQDYGPPVFIMPIPIRLRTVSGYEEFTVMNDRQEQYFVLHTDDEVLSMYFDPDNWVLCHEDWEQFRLRILSDSLSDGIQYEPYEDSIFFKGVYPGHGFVSEIISGSMPAGWNLGVSDAVISGEALESGDFTFMVLITDEIYSEAYRDSAEFTVHVEPGTPRYGDVNADHDINVGDVVFLINYIFKGGPSPVLLNWADANADCLVNVGDVVYLIGFIFNSGPEPQPGCVE